MTEEIKNAVIVSAEIDKGDKGILSVWIRVEHDSGYQGFGGHALYYPKKSDIQNWIQNGGSHAGHFIFRCLQIAGVDGWHELVGKTIRVKGSRHGIKAIGHIVKDDWFNHSEDFSNTDKEES